MADAEYRVAQMVDAVFDGSSRRAGPVALLGARRYRVLAWPDYESPSDLRALFQRYGRLLAGQPDVSLCLVHVEGTDPRLPDAIDMVRRFREEVAGPGWAEGIHFVSGSDAPDAWPDLGNAAHAVIMLPSSRSGSRRAFAHMIGTPAVDDADHLLLILNGLRVRDRATSWRLPAAPTRPEEGFDRGSTATHDPAEVWRGLGFDADAFARELIVDIACGPRLRTTWFRDARIEAIEPRASEYAEFLPWNDLGCAAAVHECDPATLVEELEGRARLVVVGEALGDEGDPDVVNDVAARYLARGGALVLQIPRGTPGPRGLVAVREWAPVGADPRHPLSVWRRG